MRKVLGFLILTVCFMMQACAGTDTVAIKTIPDGVQIYRDDVYVCDSPCDLPLKFSGTTGERYMLRLEKDGYKDRTFEMNRPMLFDKFWGGDYIAGSKFGAGNTFVFTYSLEKSAEAVTPAPQVAAPPPPYKQPAPASPVVVKQAYPKRVALVVGNSRYQRGPLPNAVNDARDVAATLRPLGFDVILVLDADLRTMEEAVDRFSRKANGAAALFFYAGHGLQVDGENYLVPIGARIDDEGDVRYEAVSAGRVLDNLRYAESSLNIVVLDACRDNPVARSFRSSTRGLAQINAPRGSIIAFSTAPGNVAADGKGRNSPYASAFMRYASDPDLSVEAFFKEVAKDVANQTGGKQRPWISSDFLGDFYFAK